MLPSERLVSYMEALRPIIYIHNFDFKAVDDLISEAAGNDVIQEYNNANGKVNFRSKAPTSLFSSPTTDDRSLIPHLSVSGSTEKKLATFLDELITDCPLRSIIVLKDVHQELNSPEIIAQLKAISQRTMYVENYWVPVIIVSSKLVIPPELEKNITVFDIPYPDRDGIEKLLERYANNFNFPISDSDKSELSLAFKGLSEFEITQILNLAYQRSGIISATDKELILREKEQTIKKSGMLEAVHVENNTSDIGGLENLVGYLTKKSYIYRNLSSAIEFGVDIPKGILIVGMPGCGKSLTAKVSARLFGAPLLRLDVGKLLGKYIGESEENLRRAIHMAEAATPCILWIDEIEKAFAGVGKDESGGGVTTRLFGYFLTWLQEKDSTVYVVATANDIEGIPPEFLRKGRFDEIFSVDLPNAVERKKIFEIHLTRRKPDWKTTNINLNELVKLTGKNSSPEFSGADIEAIVKIAIENAFWEKQRELSQKDLTDAIEMTIPIAQTMATKITNLKKSLEKYQITPATATDDKHSHEKFNLGQI